MQQISLFKPSGVSPSAAGSQDAVAAGSAAPPVHDMAAGDASPEGAGAPIDASAGAADPGGASADALPGAEGEEGGRVDPDDRGGDDHEDGPASAGPADDDHDGADPEAGDVEAPDLEAPDLEGDDGGGDGGDSGGGGDDGDGGAEDGDGDGTSVSLLEAARSRYLNYALSVITSRALPDVRDGMKPVQRRILYAMYSHLRLLHTARYRKSAAVVGEVMARFHPHGDQSIYDAMVRLAQPFALRCPLVDGHGNFGSLDGDPAAAMRYTEARLRALAEEIVAEIGQDTVPFRPNYDGTTEEPVVLPARFPALLVQGVSGIAVGMATAIPPHNLAESCRAAVALIDHPEADTRLLLEHLQGPDFPLGGEVLNPPDEILEIYETGRGTFQLRGTFHVDKDTRKKQLIIDSLPWGVVKAQLVEQIGQMIEAGKVPQLVDVRDESTDDVRVVLELKRGASEAQVMAFLYKHTALRTNVAMNLTVLVPTAREDVCAPAQIGLKAVLQHFLQFRLQTVERRFRFELRKLEERIHILRGFVTVFDALDEVIAIIRASDGKADAAEKLMARFDLDALQTDAILELKLYRLAKLQIEVVREELARLEAEASRVRAILSSPRALRGVVKTELLELAGEHGDARRTRVGGRVTHFEFDANNYILRQDTWVIVTRGGWIKRQKGFSDVSAIRVRDGDAVGWAIRCSTRSTVAFFTDRGKAYVLIADDLPQTSGYGEPVQARFKWEDGESLVGVVSMDDRNLPTYEPELDSGQGSLPGLDDPDEEDTLSGEEAPGTGPLAVAITRAGKGLLFPLSAHAEASTRSGRKFASLDGGRKLPDGVVRVTPLHGPQLKVCLATEQGRAIVFAAESLKLLQGAGRGVNAIRLADDDAVLDFALADKAHHGLEVDTNRGREVRVTERRYGVVSRGGKGFEVGKRVALVARPEAPRVIDPTAGQEPEVDPEADDVG